MGPPLFVFKGSNLPYRNVVRAGQVVSETYHDLLPRGALVAMRPELGSVDSSNFYEWAKAWVESIAYLQKDGRYTLLIYNAYRSYLSLAVLEFFAANNIVVYALPTHTSGKTQPLDVVIFGVFKSYLRDILLSAVAVHQLHTYTMYEYCSAITAAWYKAFTRSNIQASFERAGIWPFEPLRLLGTFRTATAENLQSVFDVGTMVQMMEEKLEQKRKETFGEHVVMRDKGFIDTRRGAVLTSERAQELCRARNQKLARRNARRPLTLNWRLR